MSSRITKLMNGIKVDKYPVCCDKARLITESFMGSEGESQIVRRSKALAHVLDNIPVFIRDEELIVGNAASKPMGIEIDYDYGIWSNDEIEGLVNEGYAISQDDKSAILKMNEYWRGKTLVDNMGQLLDEERLWPFKHKGQTRWLKADCTAVTRICS